MVFLLLIIQLTQDASKVEVESYITDNVLKKTFQTQIVKISNSFILFNAAITLQVIYHLNNFFTKVLNFTRPKNQ